MRPSDMPGVTRFDPMGGDDARAFRNACSDSERIGPLATHATRWGDTEARASNRMKRVAVACMVASLLSAIGWGLIIWSGFQHASELHAIVPTLETINHVL